MNTRSIELAAQIICAAMARPNAVPATIAVALDANGLLNAVDGAVELLALRARVAELEKALASNPDPIAYGPRGYRCGCGKDAHSNLTPCRPDPGELAEQRHQLLDLDADSVASLDGACLYPYLRAGGDDAR